MNLRDLLMELDGEKLDRLAPKAFSTLASIEELLQQPRLASLIEAREAFQEFKAAVEKEAK